MKDQILEVYAIHLSNNNKSLEKIASRIIKPILSALREKEVITMDFYILLMIKDFNPYLIEFNIRMGDPECQEGLEIKYGLS